MYQGELFGLFETNENEPYQVRQIAASDTYWLLKNVHYAKRIPMIMYAYGLYHLHDLVGVITYGLPPSPDVCKGICGEEYSDKVIELNRLCLVNNQKGEASRLVGASLKMLPKPKIVISYADTSQNHTGVIYQATNFIYTGLSTPNKDIMIRGKEGQHSRTFTSGSTTYADLRARYGEENIYYVERPRKHRYIYFLGNKKEVKEMRSKLRWPPQPYPKASK